MKPSDRRLQRGPFQQHDQGHCALCVFREALAGGWCQSSRRGAGRHPPSTGDGPPAPTGRSAGAPLPPRFHCAPSRGNSGRAARLCIGKKRLNVYFKTEVAFVWGRWASRCHREEQGGKPRWVEGRLGCSARGSGGGRREAATRNVADAVCPPSCPHRGRLRPAQVLEPSPWSPHNPPGHREASGKQK